ncbi:hypothetical protein X797_012448 [Metarhizium robertsii]|uniref:Uncharacterized protein n=1 Tax=Metarhizium robertsii TaxID=568076 RepID=A0A014NZV1_9HYPO|nr:hypothetical protein X797_012448 [Metarhizium robertsii]
MTVVMAEQGPDTIGIGPWIWEERIEQHASPNLFLTEEGVLALELDILKECKWRADIHEHDLLSELGLFMEFMKVAVDARNTDENNSQWLQNMKDGQPPG